MTRKHPRKRSSEIIEYQQLKTAAGGGASGGGSFYRPGEQLLCKISSIEPGGYSVLVGQYGGAGFLPTQDNLNIGENVRARFVCIHNGRILLSPQSKPIK